MKIPKIKEGDFWKWSIPTTDPECFNTKKEAVIALSLSFLFYLVLGMWLIGR